MRIAQLNTYDRGGGAERIATALLQGYIAAGHESYLGVHRKKSADPSVIALEEPMPSGPWASAMAQAAEAVRPLVGRVRGTGTLWRSFTHLQTPGHWWRHELGRESYRFQGSTSFPSRLPGPPDVLQCHNLHGGENPWQHYFDLRLLALWSQRFPVVLTLHDAWLLSGHCAHSFACQKWMSGCGHCPDLSIYPAIKRDATAWNWRYKARIFQNSRLHVATPSQWLMDKVRASMLQPGIVEQRVIPNGVDLQTFRPHPQSDVQRQLELPSDEHFVFFAGNGLQHNPWKDVPSLVESVQRLATLLPQRRITLLALGGAHVNEQIGNARLRFLRFEQEPSKVAAYYQAADLYVHPARVDTFPTTILEALACGRPVVATNVGGIPEQLRDGVTGFLVPQGDCEALAQSMRRILEDGNRAMAMGAAARADAENRFDQQRMIHDYLDWFARILQRSRDSGTSPENSQVSNPHNQAMP